MNKTFYVKIIFIFTLIALFFRFYNLEFRYMFSDVGYELEAARIINREKRFPLIGPSLGLKYFAIPPTYLYFISFIYSISSDFLFISSIYALLGFLTVFIFSLLIYLITNDKKIAVLFFAVISVWNYHVVLSSGIWHPHPVFFFLSLSLLLGVMSLKNKKIIYLFFAQLFYFVSLSIYPSPIFFLPVIFLNTFYFFKEISKKSFLKSSVYTFISLFLFWFVVYFPQIIFEIKNNFISISSLFGSFSSNPLDFNLLVAYFCKIFDRFFIISFSKEPVIFHSVLLFLFVIFSIFLSQTKRRAQPSLIKIFTNPFLFIWIFLIIFFLKNQEIDASHRTDVLNLLFFILLAIDLSFVPKINNFFKKILFLILATVFLSSFLLINFYKSLSTVRYKNLESLFINKSLANLISLKIEDKKLLNARFLIFATIGDFEKEYTAPRNRLIDNKWQAERVDYLINKKFNRESMLTDSFQMTLNGGEQIDYLETDYYFLICKIDPKNSKCLENFLSNLSNLDINRTHSFSEKELYLLQDNDVPLMKIYLIKNSQ